MLLSNMKLIRAFLLSLRELPVGGEFSLIAGYSACCIPKAFGMARLDTDVRILNKSS